MTRRCVLATVAGDPHTQGLFRVARIAARAGIEASVLPPAASADALLETIHRLDPAYVGLSYRLSPEVGVRELARVIERLAAEGLHRHASGAFRRIAVAGLPATMRALAAIAPSLPVRVTTLAQDADPVRTAARLLAFLDVPDKMAAEILEKLHAELYPTSLPELDELAREALAGDAYRDEPPLPVPSDEARSSYVRRIRESPMPLLRAHFGVPATTIEPTLEGIGEIALAHAVDEISLGSSDLSQRWFGNPVAFEGKKNDGGVPYRTFDDLVVLREAARRGNFPAIKPYAHVVDVAGFVKTCLDAGMLVGAHQAVPLFWFDELDGRGPMTVEQALVEHCAAVRELGRRGIPVEMNDPNHWASRWAHDAVVVADYGLVSAVTSAAGVGDLVLQLQLNKPRETGDLADLAKMSAAVALVEMLTPPGSPKRRLWRETRTGIDVFDPDLDRARFQLARSTMLQLILEPHAIHIVSYCEALHVATPADVIDSSRLVRRCARVFRRYAKDMVRHVDHPVVAARRAELLADAGLLLRCIAALSGSAGAEAAPLSSLVETLARPEVLHAALDRGLLAAPGIAHPRYERARAVTTGPVAHGFIECLDPTSGRVIREAERLAAIAAG